MIRPVILLFLLVLVLCGLSFLDIVLHNQELSLQGSSRRVSKPSSRLRQGTDNIKSSQVEQSSSTSAAIQNYTTWDCHASRWAVATTILEVNSAVKYLVQAFSTPPDNRTRENYDADFCLVVVGDLKTNHSEWENFVQTVYAEQGGTGSPSVVYLSPARQKVLPYKIVQYIPWNHFGRKSIGMMYAIHHGAKLIYDFDDDNHLLYQSFDKALASMQTVYSIETKHHVFNPYPYFQSTHENKRTHVWPRGFPLQFINDKNTYLSDLIVQGSSEASDDAAAPITSKFSDLAVIQSLANHDPDVDAVYRMTRQLPVYFERKNCVLRQSPGTFIPFNAQATLFRPGAFFGVLLPITVTGRTSDIWRSYILQRILWETDKRVGFSSPIVAQYRNPHSYMKDFEDEDDVYRKVDLLLKLLATWTNGFNSLDKAYLDLITLLVDNRIFQPKERDLAVAWVEDLAAVGYQWPIISNRQSPFTPLDAPIVDERDFVPAEVLIRYRIR